MKNHYSEESLRERFKNHRYTISGCKTHLGDVTVLEWGHPNGSSIDRVVYVFLRGTVMVSGDLGSATYNWYSPVSVQAVAGYGLQYFHGKCEASANGQQPAEWNQKQAIARIREKVAYEFEDSETPDMTAEKYFDEIAEDNLEEATKHPHGWANFIANNEEQTIFDFEDYGIGNIIPLRTCMHWVGIKMAQEQIEAYNKSWQEERSYESSNSL